MIEKDPDGVSAGGAVGVSTGVRIGKKVVRELPGTSEGKAAMLEFELPQLELPKSEFIESEVVEEQVCFDFGEEFEAQLSVAKPTVAKTPAQDESVNQAASTTSSVVATAPVTEIMIEEASIASLEESDPVVLDETSLPALQVGTDAELMQSIEAIPEKMAFKIGEVGDMVGVKQYVLRYWESEFDALKPRKSRNGQRIYTRRDVETALMIKKLLYTDRFSIEGARSALKQLKSRVREEKEWRRLLARHEQVRSGLSSLLAEIRKLRESYT